MKILIEKEIKNVIGGANCICLESTDYGPGHSPWMGDLKNIGQCHKQCCENIGTPYYAWYGKHYRC